MAANEFNEQVVLLAAEKLIPIGFKKKGVHFYLHRSPVILVFYKNTFRGSFENFCAALTYDFLSNTKDSNGKLEIPPYLEDYPVSIELKELKKQYRQHAAVTDFDYDLNFLSREVLTTRKFSLRYLTGLLKQGISENTNENEGDCILSAMDTMYTDGMRFLSGCSPQIAYKTVSRYSTDDPVLNGFRKELETWLISQGMAVPQKQKWYAKLFR